MYKKQNMYYFACFNKTAVKKQYFQTSSKYRVCLFSVFLESLFLTKILFLKNRLFDKAEKKQNILVLCYTLS